MPKAQVMGVFALHPCPLLSVCYAGDYDSIRKFNISFVIFSIHVFGIE